MASLSEAYFTPSSAAQERTENPQKYDQLPEFVQHVKERRHILGLVGGNEVSRAAGNAVDLESDLLGITRPNSYSTERHHLPKDESSTITRNNPKLNISINAKAVPLQSFQLWAYPGVVAPLPLEKETCSKPEKY